MSRDDAHDPNDSPEERRGLEDEIEEILRQQGEQPVPRRRRESQRRHPRLPRIEQGARSALATLAVQYALGIAIALGLLFLAFRTLGPAGLRLAVMALFLFLLFYTVRGLVLDIKRRRPR